MIPDEVEELKGARVEVVNLDPGGSALFFAEDGVEELGDEDLALSRALRRKGDFDEAARGLLHQESSGPVRSLPAPAGEKERRVDGVGF